jgi:hypothetical protein
VAVTAIRGLIVGTTCSLALLTEDRRRRISNAQNVIQNGDRIRSAKNYRSGGAELALAIEEDAVLFDPYPVRVRWTEAQLQGLGRTRAKEEGWGERTQRELAGGPRQVQQPESVEHTRGQEVETNNEQVVRKPKAFGRARTWREKPKSMIQPLPILDPTTDMARSTLNDRSRTSTSSATTLLATTSLAFPEMEEITALVEQCAATRDVRQVDHVILLVLQALGPEVGRGGELGEPLVKAAALLVRTCQEMGRFDAAANILNEVLRCGQLKENDYYDFRPLDLLEHGLLPELDGNCPNGRVDARKLALATDLYLPQFVNDPQTRTDRGFAIGRRLLELSFAAGWKEKMDSIYWRCLVHRQDDFEFTQWFITQLHRNGDYKRAIKFFLLTYPKMSPSQASIRETGNVVVASVAAARGMKARHGLQTLAQLCSSSHPMASEWVTKLLECDWERRRDFDKTMELYNHLGDRGGRGLQGVVTCPRDVYRVMVDIASRAGRPDMTELILKQAAVDIPTLATDAHVVGTRALIKARSGDWAAVERDFQSIKDQDNSPDDIAQAFSPILKVYAQTHTITQTDEFLRHYVSHVGVPICKRTATFMAKEYGAVRDGESLVAWLEYCVEAGFTIDAAFTNSILSNCRTNWKLPFRDLRRLYERIRELGGGYTDRNTERIMFDAAVAQSKREPVDFRVRRLKVKIPQSLALAGRCYSGQEVLLSMKERLAVGRPQQALLIYRRARNKGLDLAAEAHRLAIKVNLALDGGNIEGAYAVLADAQKQGQDTRNWAIPILSAQLAQVSGSLTNEQKYLAIREILDGLEERKIRVSDAMLNMAAHTCLTIKHTMGAIKLATMAAETHHNPTATTTTPAKADNLCYNMYNFSVLVQAFARTVDVGMLRFVVARARTNLYWTEMFCRTALKHAKKTLDQKNDTPRVEEAREIISQALEETKVKRKELADDRVELQRDMFGILQKAAMEARGRDYAGVGGDLERPAATHEELSGASGLDDEFEMIPEAAVTTR